jgi:hypothetical protein
MLNSEDPLWLRGISLLLHRWTGLLTPVLQNRLRLRYRRRCWRGWLDMWYRGWLSLSLLLHSVLHLVDAHVIVMVV